MMNNRSLRRFKVILIILIVICILTIVFLTIGYSNASALFEAYNNVTKEGNNYSNQKRLNFLTSYIRTTGDITILTSMGLSKEQQEEILEMVEQEQELANSDSAEFNGFGGVLSGGWKQQLDTLYASGIDDSLHYQASNFTIANIGGKEYIWEKQISGTFPTDLMGRRINSVGAGGCMLFALCSYISNQTGKLYSISMMCEDRVIDVDFQNNEYILGSAENGYPYVGGGGGNLKHAKDLLSAVRSDYGSYSVEELSNYSKGQIDSILGEGDWLLYHANESSGDQYLSGGSAREHWTIIMGSSGNNYVLLNNGVRDSWQDKRNRSYYVNKDYIVSKCTSLMRLHKNS